MSSLKAKQPKKPLPKRTRNVEKSKRTQLTTSSSTESPPSDNEDFPSTKVSPRSYHRALKDYPNMSKEQRDIRGMFKNLDVLKNLKNPRQVVRGVQVGLKVRIRLTKQIYQPVSKNNGANTSGKKKQAEFPRQEKNYVDDDYDPYDDDDMYEGPEIPNNIQAICDNLDYQELKVGNHLPKKQVYQPISKKSGASSSSIEKQAGLTRQDASNSNMFDALNMVKNNDVLGTNGGNSKFTGKGVNNNEVSMHETSPVVFGGPTNTPLAERINDLERQMLDGKLVLVDNDRKLIKKVDDLVNGNSDSEMDEVFDETTSFMATTSSKVNGSSKIGSGVGNKSLYEQQRETYNEYPYNIDDWIKGFSGKIYY
nr:hypothetical protein [Tanacetum cinerariifolium]